MILIIDPAFEVFNSLSQANIFSRLSEIVQALKKIDVEELNGIKAINLISKKKTNLFNKVREEILGNVSFFGPKRSTNHLKKLFIKAQLISDLTQINSNEKSKFIFIYPFISSNLLDHIKTQKYFEGYISYRDFIFIDSNSRTEKIQDVNKFIELFDQTNQINDQSKKVNLKKEAVPGLLEILFPSLHKNIPSYSNNSINIIVSDSRIIAEEAIRLLLKYNYQDYSIIDLSESENEIPLTANKNCIFFNTDSLPLQRQNELLNKLASFKDDELIKKIFHYKNAENILPRIKGNGNLIDLSIIDITPEQLSQCFVSMLVQKNKLLYGTKNAKFFKDLSKFVYSYNSVDVMDRCINALTPLNSSDILLLPEFWYEFNRKYTLVTKENTDKQQIKNDIEKYFIKYRGNYWEVNFNYEGGPILLANSVGMYYLAALMAQPNTPVDYKDLTKKYAKKKEYDSPERGAQSIINAIEGCKISIADVESSLSIKNKFSSYLNKSKFSKDKINSSKTYTVIFIPATDNKIKWFIPIVPAKSILYS
ncbi:MAG: hypothetical protein IPJ23_11545 [Ignavibacteriales bacterium]|nr:hypothetical protein [Ignavibacteriales bacterium]